jgi:transcriptional regulator with XRE-family HTH domain
MPDIIAERQNLSTVKAQTGLPGHVAVWQHDGMSFGARLRETRKARGLKGIQLAERSGVDGSTISRYEKGERLAPEADKVARLAKALGVNVPWLLTGDGPREPGPVVIETPVGRAALEAVLFTYEWPDEIRSETVTEIEGLLRAEAQTSAGAGRSAAAWRHRAREFIRAREPGRKSRPRLTGAAK